jgi:plasmid stabilization system protein ParE
MAHRVSPRAEADLDDIWFYTAKESGSIEIDRKGSFFALTEAKPID